jgi:hypothetical protein
VSEEKQLIQELCTLLDCPSEESLRPEIERLLKKNADLQDMVEGNVRDVIINEMHFEKGALEVYLKHPIFALFAGAIAEYFIETGAKNYLETRIWCEKVGFVIVTCQKETGHSPHQLRQSAEAERNAFLEEICAARAVLGKYHPAGEDAPFNLAGLAAWVIQSLVEDASRLAQRLRYARDVGALQGRRLKPRTSELLDQHDALFSEMHIEEQS